MMAVITAASTMGKRDSRDEDAPAAGLADTGGTKPGAASWAASGAANAWGTGAGAASTGGAGAGGAGAGGRFAPTRSAVWRSVLSSATLSARLSTRVSTPWTRSREAGAGVGRLGSRLVVGSDMDGVGEEARLRGWNRPVAFRRGGMQLCVKAKRERVRARLRARR